MDRAVPFARVVDGVVPALRLPPIFTGAGKVGAETPALDAEHRRTSSSPSGPSSSRRRSGLETTLKRPIVNTRDEPHADPQRYRRLHVIVGDANLSEVATFLKVGTTALVLAMIEDDVSGRAASLALADPVRAMHQVSARPHLHPAARRWPTARRPPPSSIQWELFGAGPQVRRGARPRRAWATRRRRRRWSCAAGRRSSTASRPTRRPWPASSTGWPSSSCSQAYQERHGCGWDDHRLAALDLQYHDLRPGRVRCSPAWTCERLVDAGAGRRGRHRAAPGHPGLVPGQVPGPLARRGGHRQLGFAGLRPRHRPAAARPYDGPLKGTAEHVGAAAGSSARVRPSCWTG